MKTCPVFKEFLSDNQFSSGPLKIARGLPFGGETDIWVFFFSTTSLVLMFDIFSLLLWKMNLDSPGIERQNVFLLETFKKMTSEWDELSKMKHQNSKAIMISCKNSPIKTVDLNGKTPFLNKIRVKLFFPFNKTKLRDFEHFKLVLGDHAPWTRPINTSTPFWNPSFGILWIV